MHKFIRDTGGASLVEFAIAAPFFLLLVAGLTDFGLLMNNSTVLEASVRSVAEMVKANPVVTGSQIPASLLPSGASSPTIQAPVCYCASNPTVAVTCPVISTGFTPNCGGQNPYVAALTNDTRIIQRVGISASQPNSTIVPWTGLTLPASFTPVADARTQ